MVVRKRKKTTRYRGSTTHGCGSMKKRRGAGNRGGRGNAGSGGSGSSASGSKKPSYWKHRVGGKDPEKRGFTSYKKREVTINVGHLNSIAETLVRSGKAIEKAGVIVINLRELGYTKILGAGKVTHKLSIGVKGTTQSAADKIAKAGGKVDSDYVAGQEDVSKDALAAPEPKAEAVKVEAAQNEE